MPASASPPPSPPVRTPGQQPSHPASATNRSRTPKNDRFALYSPRNPDRRWIRVKAGILVGLGRGHEDDVLEVDLVERLDCVDVEAGQQCGVPPVIFSLATSTPTPLYVRAGMGDWPPTPSTPPRTSRPSPLVQPCGMAQRVRVEGEWRRLLALAAAVGRDFTFEEL